MKIVIFKIASYINKKYIFVLNIFNNNKISFHSKLFLKVSIKIKGIMNFLEFKGDSDVKKSKFIILGDKNILLIKNGASINNLNLLIKGTDNYIEIGENSKISKLDIIVNSTSSKLIIGDNTTISGLSEIIVKEGKDLSIGNDCMISRGVIFRTSDSHSIINVKNDERVNYAKDILIGDHVWIGQNVTILKGTQIEKNSIIASNTVVTKHIKGTNVVIGSIPAKILKTDVNWCRELIDLED